MTNKTYSEAQLIYLKPEEKKNAENEADKLGLSVTGFFRMLLNTWLKKNKSDK